MFTMRPWLLSIALGIALFNAPPAQADVPEQIIDQIADLRVQQAELKHLTAIGKLTGADAVTKQQAIEAQIKTLYLPYRAEPSVEDTRARTAIDRLVADKLSLMRPQWIQEESAFKAARDQHNKQLSAEAEDDARTSAELQRQRVVLQKQLAAGTLTQDAFTAQDKQASDAIAAFRKKYDDAGEQWPRRFEQRYRVLLEVALKNPDTPLPLPSVATAQPAVAAAPPRPAAVSAPPAPQKIAPIQQTASSGSALVGLVVIGSIIGAIVLAIWWFLGRKARRLSRIERKRRINNQNALSKFGTTQEERSKNIDSVFDKKAAGVGFDLNEDKIICRLFRSLSAMAPREREVLRTAYHLYNLGLIGSDTSFFLIRFALIYGDGKAVINGSTKYPNNNPAITSISTALKWYQGSDGHEAMINVTLNWLQTATKNNQDNPVLRKLSARLHGDGGDLAPGAPLKSAAKGAPVEAGLILGLDEKAPDTWWYYDGEGSLITVAPPGSGKTQCQVFPNLLMWKGAAVVLDVKGEIYEQTSKWRRENVGPVYKFSPLDPATSHGYNPLAEVRADPDYLWEDARFLADMMIVPSGAKDPFWESRARDVLTAAIARVCIADDIAKRSMEDVLNILHGVGWDKFVTYLEARIDFPSMTRAGHSLASMEPKTRDGVLQSALSSMSAWDGERIARATRKSDWSPLDLRGGKNPTIYICLKPNEVDSYISVLRVFIAQHIRSLTSTKVPAHGVQPILFVLDELPRLRHMPPVEEALEIGRQYGIKLWLFAQSLGQLEVAYPNADGMIGGCAIRMFMNPSLHDETAQKVSDDIGFMDSVIDGTRVKIVEPNVLSGPDYKDLVIVMAAHARAARLKKYFAHADDALNARMGSV